MTNRVAVLEKAFHALEVMSDFGRAASLKELAEASKLPKATLFRILQTLVHMGYVDQDHARSRYALTLRLLQLGREDSFDEAKQIAQSIMESLHARFNETVNLGILQGTNVVYADCLETSQSLRWQVRPGAHDPFHTTALGRAIVAYLPEKRREQLLDRMQLDPRTPFTPQTRAHVEQILENTRTFGLAQDNQENDLGVVCYGMPLLVDDFPIASLSISVPKSRLTPELDREITSALRDALAARRELAGQSERRKAS